MLRYSLCGSTTFCEKRSIQKRRQIISKGYDDIADLMYRKVKQGDFILVEGKLRENVVEVLDFIK